MHENWYTRVFLFVYEENTWRIHAKLKATTHRDKRRQFDDR